MCNLFRLSSKELYYHFFFKEFSRKMMRRFKTLDAQAVTGGTPKEFFSKVKVK